VLLQCSKRITVGSVDKLMRMNFIHYVT